jgi:diaminopimelate decarboxylase
MPGMDSLEHHDLPFAAPDTLRELAQRHGTPLWVYDADTVLRQLQPLREGFDTVRYAQKANPNLHLLRLLRAHGAVVDAVSAGEIERALAAGFRPGWDSEEIVFTADVLDRPTLELVVAHRVVVNAGSIDMLDQLGARSPGHPVWLRVNPGFGHGHSRKTNTGGPHSKHGIWHEDLPGACAALRRHGLRLAGVHMHIGSGADVEHLARVCDAMVDTVAGLDLPVPAISAGGGLSVPYRAGEAMPDVRRYAELWRQAQARIAQRTGLRPRLEIEPGRFIAAPAGVLLAEVRAVKRAGDNRFALLDAGMSELIRPSLYGGHHRISAIPGDVSRAYGQELVDTIVAGPLCESGDVFTQGADGTVLPRALPAVRTGDLLAFHDAGAYGAAMSSNYNSRPLAAEVLLEGGAARLVRRRQTMAELLALEEAGPFKAAMGC